MNALHDAEVGDKVHVHAHHGLPKLRHVTKTTARKVTLSDGSEWTRHGSPWGSSSDTWRSAWAAVATAAAIARVADQRAEIQAERRDLAERIKSRLLTASTPQLRRIAKDLGA